MRLATRLRRLARVWDYLLGNSPVPTRVRLSRLGVEGLEDRTVPSAPPAGPTVTVEKFSDATEGGADGVFRFTRTGDTSDSLTVNVAIGGTAMPDEDYASLGETVTVEFAPGSATADLTVGATDDAAPEFAETVTASVLVGSAYAVGSPEAATVTITDNETPVVAVNRLFDATEGASSGFFHLTRTGDTASPLTVNLSVDGTATDGADYTAIGGQVTFAAGASSAFVEVAAGADGVFDPDETVTVIAQAGAGYVLGTASATVSIEDAVPVVTVARVGDAIEGGSVGQFRFTRTGDLSSALTVNIAVAGAAIPGADYTALAGQLTFAPGEATVDVAITAPPDAEVEGDETVVVTVEPGSGYVVGSTAAATAFVVDDPAVVTLSPATQTMSEGESGWAGWWGTDGVVVVSRTGGNLAQSLPVQLRIEPSGSVAPAAWWDDYTLTGPDGVALVPDQNGVATVLLAPGHGRAEIAVTAKADGATESTEGFRVTVLADTAYVLGAASVADVLIEDATPGVVNLVAHRTGGHFGEEVDESVEDGGDPGDFVVLVNDDGEEGTNGPDNKNDTALVPSDSDSVADDDLIWVALKRLPSTVTDGTVSIEVSNPGAVRLFKADGTPLTNLTLDVSAPSGDLSPLLTGNLGIWAEATAVDPDFVLSLVYRDSSGQEVDRDEVHLLFARLALTDPYGETTSLYQPTTAGTLLDAVAGTATVPENAKFKVSVQGPTASQVTELKVGSATNSYLDTLVPAGGGLVSQDWGVFYNGSPTVLTPQQLDAIKQSLSLNAVSAQQPKVEMKTEKDRQERQKVFVSLQILQADSAFDNAEINRLIYDSGKKVKFTIPDLPQGSTVAWDLNGDGKFGDGVFEKVATGTTEVTYSKAQDAAANVNLPNTAENRRKVYQVGAKVTVGGKEVVLTRPIRVALETKRVLNDLPDYLPDGTKPYDAAKSHDWLKDTYYYAKYPTLSPDQFLPWTDFADMPKEIQQQIVQALGGNDKQLIANFNANRLVIGTGAAGLPAEIVSGGATTYTFSGSPTNAFAYPDMKVAGTVLFGGAQSPAFKFDKAELSYIVNHEAAQLGVAKTASQGKNFGLQVYAMYANSPDKKVQAKATKVAYLWNQLEVAHEDFKRVAASDAAKKNGDVSWHFYQPFLGLYSKLYALLLSDDDGSLTEIKKLDGEGKLATATGQQVSNFTSALTRLQLMYNDIKAQGQAWEDLLLVANNFPGKLHHLAYRFADPSEVVKP